MTDYGLSSTPRQPGYLKDADDTESYVFNFAGYLDGDTISAVEFSLPDGMTSVSSSYDDTTATIFVSGGDEYQTYRVRCRITTTAGRTKDKTYYVLIQEQ